MSQIVKSELLCTASKDIEKFDNEDLEETLTSDDDDLSYVNKIKKEEKDAIAKFSN